MVDDQDLVQYSSLEDPDNAELKDVSKIADVGGKDVLIIGCDSGKLLSGLSGYTKMTVIDDSQERIDFWKRKLQKNGIDFVKTWLGSTAFPDASFDVIIAARTLGTPQHYGSIIWDLSRLLKPQGKIVITQESGLGDYEELKDGFCPGYKKMVKLNNAELIRQLARFFSKVNQHNLPIPEAYPDMKTAIEAFTFDMKICTKKCDLDSGRQKEALQKFEKDGKVLITKGIIVITAS